MAYSAAPVHFLFYNSMRHRSLWLKSLESTFTPYAKAEWPAKLAKIHQNFKRLQTVFPDTPFDLNFALDDTPIESFLNGIYETLMTFERFFFDEISQNFAHPEWKEALEETSMLWGRSLAQAQLKDIKSGMNQFVSPHQILHSFQSTFFGGDFLWKPFMVRRLAQHELQYEPRTCPHQQHTISAEKGLADLACHLEAAVFKGFTQALNRNLLYKRENRKGYCIDTVEFPMG